MSQKGMKETRQVGIPDAKECNTRHFNKLGKASPLLFLVSHCSSENIRNIHEKRNYPQQGKQSLLIMMFIPPVRYIGNVQLTSKY